MGAADAASAGSSESGQGKVSSNLVAGTAVGAVQSVLFNPWDRALFLSVKEKRSFLVRENFSNPWQGWGQSAVQRTVSGGLYFVLQGLVEDALPVHQPFVVGLVAGALNGAALSPLAALKYHNWGSEFSWRGSLRHALAHGGPAVFLRGMGATVARDAVFGVSYEVLRARLHRTGESPAWHVAANVAAAAMATVFSAPLNYVRSMQYAHMADDEPPRRIGEQLRRLWANAKVQQSPARYVAQRLRLGWGTLRVATAMGLAQWIFAHIKDKM